MLLFAKEIVLYRCWLWPHQLFMNTGGTTQTIYADTAGTYNVTVGNGTAVSNTNSLSFGVVELDIM